MVGFFELTDQLPKTFNKLILFKNLHRPFLKSETSEDNEPIADTPSGY